jgi:hypothetical protein
MPWQSHLWIGEPVHNYQEVRDAFLCAGVSKAEMPRKNDNLYTVRIDISDKIRHLPFVPDGNKYTINFVWEAESGVYFPPESELDEQSPFALVGFQITGRYEGKILDRDYADDGRPDPFVIDLDEVQMLLNEVHLWWPEAKFMIMDNFF